MDEKGAEGPVNYAVRGDMIVVDGVPSELVLRSGRNKAVLTHIPPTPAPNRASPAPVEEKK
jgi:type IV secretion system protein VirB9